MNIIMIGLCLSPGTVRKFNATFYWRMEKSPVPLLINKLKLTKNLFPHESSEVQQAQIN